MDYIRKFIESDLEPVMRIWYEGNLEAHDFVNKEYWDRNYNYVKKAVMQSDVYIYESNGHVAGFVGMDGDYLQGLFVHKDFRGQGYGTRLIERIKEDNDFFTLHVFEQNYGAFTFYRNRGLLIREKEVNEDLGEVEFLMYYRKKKEEE